VALRIETGYYRSISIVFVCDECAFRQEIEGTSEAVFERVVRLLQHRLEQKFLAHSLVNTDL
jgi:hypothetical protein